MTGILKFKKFVTCQGVLDFYVYLFLGLSALRLQCKTKVHGTCKLANH